MRKLLLLVIISCSHNLWAQWYWTNPYPQGNAINTFELVSNKIIALGSYGTVMISSNQGSNWSVNNNAANIVQSLTALQCYNENIFYAGVYGAGSTIIKSTNSGVNWEILSSGFYSSIQPSAIQFVDTDIGYLLSKRILFKTTNGGNNWGSPVFLPGMQEGTDVHFFNKDTGLVCGGDFLFGSNTMLRTTNGGQNWTSILHTTDAGVIFKVQFLNNDTGFAFQDRVTYKSTNQGISWDILGNPGSQIGGYGHFINYNTGYLLRYGDFYKTTNAGSNWIKNELNLFGAWKLDFINQDTGYILCDNNRLLRTTNAGDNWVDMMDMTGSGTASKNLLNSHFINQNTGIVVGWVGQILKTTNSGSNWEKATINDSSGFSVIVDVDFVNNNTGYCIRSSTAHGNILKSTDSGNNWYVADSIGTTGFGLSSINFINSSTGFIINDEGNVYRTTNAGNDWSLLTNLGNIELDNLIFTDNNTGFLTGYEHPNMVSIHKTTNTGSNWSQISSLNVQDFSSLFSTDGNTLFATGRGLYKSTNGGVNWTQVLNGSLATTILSNVYFSSDSVGYLTGSGIMLKSTDYGNNWYPLYIPTGNSLNGIHFFDNNTGITIGGNATILRTTNGGGNFVTNITNTSNIIPNGYFLHQNFPNPFNPSTNIKFDIPVASYVELTVFDISGKEIKKLVSQNLNAGSYNYNWNAKNYSSGVYFYQLKVTGGSEYFEKTRKMLLVK